MKKSTNSGGAILRAFQKVDALILKGWRIFISLKFGIFLLAMIGVACIYGTMKYASNPALGQNAIPMARGLFFENKWFITLLMLFALNLILSTWHVTVMSFTIWWKREFRRDVDYYKHGSGLRGAVKIANGPEEVLPILSQNFSRAHRDGNAFFAHKGILSRLGPTIVHIGMLTVIFSVVAKAVLMWNGKIMTEGRFLAAEGEMSNIVHQPLAIEQQITDQNRVESPIDVWVKVLDFDEIKHPNSDVPSYFSSLVEIRDPATQQLTVAQLDMNHSLPIKTSRFGVLKFHQAGYEKVADDTQPRMNFDVRDSVTGERIAITDATTHDRVRVGDTNLMLEVDGLESGNAWRLFDTAKPDDAVASGALVGGTKIAYQVRADEFFTDLQIDEQTKKPVNGSKLLKNGALRISILKDGKLADSELVFIDKQLAEMAPSTHPQFRLQLTDIKVLKNADAASVDWNKPGQALFTVSVLDGKTAMETTSLDLILGEASKTFEFREMKSATSPEIASKSAYDVRIVGPAQRYMTVLSVVNEPTVWWTNLGVAITVIGALMTFIFRYRAFYGIWDDRENVLRMALVPRWGQTPVKTEFDKLMMLFSHGEKATTSLVNDSTSEIEELEASPETANIPDSKGAEK